jgi:hypothetical protein
MSFQSVDCFILAEDIISDLGMGHSFAHGWGRLRYRVGSQINELVW